MPLKLTCPTCSQPTRLSEPYPLPGAEIMCTSCGVAMTVSYPTGVIQKLRDRGKTFAEDQVVIPPPPPAPHLGRSIHPSLQTEPPEPTTSHEPTELASPQGPPAARSIDLDSIPSGPVKRRRPPPPMTMPSFSMADPYAGDPDSDVPDESPPAAFAGGATSSRSIATEPTAPLPRPPSVPGTASEEPTAALPSSSIAQEPTAALPQDRHQEPGEPTLPLPPPAPRGGGKPLAAPEGDGGPNPRKNSRKKRRRETKKPASKKGSFVWRWTKRLGCLALLLGLIGVAVAAGALFFVHQHYSKDLPSVDALENYRPPTVTEVYDRDGTLMGELYEQRRYVVPIDEIPEHVRHAFIYAEDSQFYDHGGVDFFGLARATLNEVMGGSKRQGASTITMQVTRNFLLTRDKTYERKIKEILLAQRIESVYDKDTILWLYLNEIYLGSGAYGVEAASRVYFGKHVGDLTTAEAALIAGLAPAPSTYSPHRNFDRARTRQLYVLDQMLQKGSIDEPTHRAAVDEHIKIVREENPFLTLAPHFTERVRRHLMERYGFDAVYKDGLRVITTMDLPVQLVAQESVVRNVHRVDQRMGFRRAGLVTLSSDAEIQAHRDAKEQEIREANRFKEDPALRVPLPDRSRLEPEEVYEGVVLEAKPKWLRVGVGTHEIIVPIAWSTWAYEPNPKWSWRRRVADDFTVEVRGWEDDVEKGGALIRPGDVIVVKLAHVSSVDPQLPDDTPDLAKEKAQITKALKGTPAADEDLPVARLWQIPEVEAAAMAYDVHTGAVRAMVGGSDFSKSEFNRATQARRQVGSTFKPIVYAAAIDTERLTAASIVPDVRGASYTTDAGFVWKPDNYGAEYLGNITLRKALAMSKNTCTVKVLESMDPGMNDDVLYRFARKLGIGGPPTHLLPEDHVPLPSNDRLCPWVRETPESTICMDRYPPKDPNMSNTRHRLLMKPDDVYMCRACDMSMGLGSASLTMEELLRAYSPFVTDGRLVQPHYIVKVTDRDGQILEEHDPQPFPQVVRPEVATITNWLLQNVINTGTGYDAKRELGLKLGGKTGTSQDYKDTWFVGFSPDVLTATWVGFDEPRSLGVSSTGGRTALPIWIDIMREAAPKEKDRPFATHGDIEWALIDEKRGIRVTSGGMRYPFLEDTVPTSTGVAADEYTVDDFTDL
ncbi:MAG: hypothetical protein EA397_06185 [Deltaproteobacteria bacterium]|nr:MAG: hypothetical protein EA397_06185 [Deltaproteobacteria bacterium]